MDVALAYDGRLFVTPKEPCQWVHSSVKRWKSAHSSSSGPWERLAGSRQELALAPGDQVLLLVGEHGSGKTWLLRHLAESEQMLASSSVYLNLDERHRFSGSADYVRAVEAQIQQHCGQEPAVLLLDAVPPQMDEYLRALEDAILRPQLMHRSSLVVMALMRPSLVCWCAPALRGGKVWFLGKFDDSMTAAQLQKLKQAGPILDDLDAQALQQLGGGLPLLTYLLASWPVREAFELLLEYWFSPLSGDERARARNYLDAVCVLDVLEHASIQRALEVYYHYLPDAGGFPAHAGGVRNILQKHWLARPAARTPGRLVLVESVQRAARQVLWARDSVLYQLLSEAVPDARER